MKHILLLIIICISSSAMSAVKGDVFNATIAYEPPPENLWKMADNKEGESKGVVRYTRESIKDPKLGIEIIPNLAFIYEKTPPTITNVKEYIALAESRETLPYTLEHKMKHRDGEVNFYTYIDSYKLKHVVIIGFYWDKSVGLQVMGDSIESVYSFVEKDFENFIMSFYWQ